ncbi:HAD-superfamily hydrolase, subfamily IIB [Microbacterium esteraromaticum]|uniref:HAD-superfamily hydrolase, subfamily IIB n=1 Tax=Microbacterium esteraromaticum TaxID=57043 RepID=A0A1R4KP13_9MICO|nr:HAD family hydrolase [Microbacterium esteraromaticum]SJN45975.1 HAD-superfamily hydrolase, subfamily IIB [Microbacterium esteraromaticum]
MTARGLVGLDIDGTILLQDETLSPGVAEAVAEVRDAGYEVMLATGRSWSATQRYHELLELTAEYAVCSNGAVTMRRVGDEWERWHVEVFDPKTVLGLLTERLPEARYMVELGSGQRLYTQLLHDWTLDNGREVSMEELAAQPVSRVVVVSPEHDEADFHRLVAEAGLNEVSYAVGWTAWLDIAPHGVNKGTALERVRDVQGIARDRVLVVGDGRNDIGMFEWAVDGGGRAASMGQAPEDVHQVAGEVTGHVDVGGLATVLRTLL